MYKLIWQESQLKLMFIYTKRQNLLQFSYNNILHNIYIYIYELLK